MATINFDNPIGWYALLSVIPLIILYLIRPKPRLMTIPSLMFFLKASGANRIISFFKQVTKDWLFLIQLLTLLLCALILVKPYSDFMHDITSANTVIVIDASASMQTIEGGTTRFNIAVQKAKEVLGGRNTIIVAKHFPQIITKDATSFESRSILNSLKPYESSTPLGDAILLAGETLADREGRVVVLSDFINTEGQDPETARSVLKSRRIVVDFINAATLQQKENVGFVDLLVDEDSTIAYIKNFGNTQKSLTLKYGNQKKDITIPANNVEPFVFKTVEGVTKLELQTNDALPADNVIHVSAPTKLRSKVLLITNSKSVFLENGLKASDMIDLTIAEPPIVPKGNYDIYVIHDIKGKEILTGTFEEIAKKVEEGANLIIHAQDDYFDIKYNLLTDLSIVGSGGNSPLIIQQVNRFIKNIDFGSVNYFNKAKKTSSMNVIVSAEDYPIISLQQKGKGKILYYGIIEKASDFKFSPNYPIFWTEVIKYLTEKQDITKLNMKTNKVLILDSQEQVKTPSKIIPSATTVFVEESGLYTFSNRVVAANLLDEKESAITSSQSFGQKSVDYKLQPVKEKRKFDFELPLAIILGLLFLFEMFYVKIRGDI